MEHVVKQRLLERIRKMEDSPEARLTTSATDVLDSVLEYLQKLLNTKKGSVDIDNEFGVPDLTNISSSFTDDAIPGLESSIKKVIEDFEPRLKDVAVKFVTEQHDRMKLRFSISAKLATEDKAGQIIFETIVDSDGQIKVTSNS